MYVVIVTPNKNGKIELTKEELQKMLDEAYSHGYTQGKTDNMSTITVPSWPTQPWYSTVTTADNTSHITLNQTDNK